MKLGEIDVTFRICFLLLSVVVIFADGKSVQKNPAHQLIRDDGYNVEIHKVTTIDGYILELLRIPSLRNESISSMQRKPVALMTLCLLCCSSCFVILGKDRGLAYMVANAGYDVWILSNRGTIASQKHVKLSPKSRKFWQFSWHEMGIYDTSASLDYVLKVTGENQVDYIGYSMGSTQFFVLMSERPEYNAKVRKMIALSPSAFYGKSTSPYFPLLPPVSDILTFYGAESGRLQFPPPELDLNDMLIALCKLQNNMLFGSICMMTVRGLGATDNGNVNSKMLPYYLQYFPDRSSIRTALHYTQLRNSRKFEKYNYGTRLNLEIYGSSLPPSYNLSKISVPLNLFWSLGDEIVNYMDVAFLESLLPNVEFSYQVPFASFSHLDFIWGDNAPSLVYEVVIERLKQGLYPTVTSRRSPISRR